MSHSKRRKASNRPSLKSQGAKYSTTNRKGETTFFKSSKDASGYSDTFEGKGEASKGNAPISRVDSTGNVITAESLTPNTPITIPKTEVATVPDFVANYAGLTGGETGLSTVGNKLTVDPANTTEDPYAGLMQQFLDNTQNIEDSRTTGADVFRQVEKESGIKAYQQEANNLSGQLNSITASRDAAVLSLEGQGRGQTSGFIGGEQARINREAAIKALPIQAQLATAQGNVALAQDHINTWGKILMDDANNEYNHKIAVNNSIFSYLTDAEKRRQDVIQKADDRAYAEKTALITAKTNAISNALGQGAPSSVQTAIQNARTLDEVAVATGIYNADVLGQQIKRKQLADLNAPKSTTRDTQFDPSGNLVDMQTGEVITKAGGSAGSLEEKQKTLDQISFLQTTIKDAENLASATGPNLITKGVGNLFIGNTRVKQLATKLDTLKTNLLTLNSDPALKKFFGPQMTEKDTQLLMSAGSTLNAYDSSETDNRAELTRYSELLNRMQTAISNGGATFGLTLTGADGLQYIISD